MENEGGVGGEGVAEEGLGLRDKMETVGKNGLGVNWPVSGDKVKGLFSGVGGRSEPVMERGNEAEGISEEGAENGVAVKAGDAAVGGQRGAGGGDVPGVWVVTVGVRGKSAQGAQGAMIL